MNCTYVVLGTLESPVFDVAGLPDLPGEAAERFLPAEFPSFLTRERSTCWRKSKAGSPCSTGRRASHCDDVGGMLEAFHLALHVDVHLPLITRHLKLHL